MPNYKYKCLNCEHESIETLPMSYDPKILLCCPECFGSMSRRISIPTIVMERETLGKWYHEQTGKKLLED